MGEHKNGLEEGFSDILEESRVNSLEEDYSDGLERRL